MPDTAMSPEDFFDISSDGNVQLLDEVGRPLVELPPASRGLAEVATTIHGHASELTDDQFEQSIQWLKALKMRDRAPARPTYEFLSVLNELRNSPGQTELQQRGHRKLWLAKGISMLLALVFAAAVALTVSHHWVAVGMALLIAFALFVIGERITVSAIQIFKEQDQRHVWASIRQARSVEEANLAGIFAFLHGATFGAQGYSEDSARAAMRAERERLTDALYADPTDYLVYYGENRL